MDKEYLMQNLFTEQEKRDGANLSVETILKRIEKIYENPSELNKGKTKPISEEKDGIFGKWIFAEAVGDMSFMLDGRGRGYEIYECSVCGQRSFNKWRICRRCNSEMSNGYMGM